MKLPLSVFFLFFSIFLNSFAYETPESRLIDVELEYTQAVASGLGEKSPVVRGLKAEMKFLHRVVNIDPATHRKILEQQKILLIAKKIRVETDLSTNHPDVQLLDSQIVLLGKLIKRFVSLK